MSQAVVMEIIGKAIDDKNFRKKLFKHPDKALKGYDLTDEERASLSDLDENNFDDFAGGLGDRTTKGMIPGTG